MNKKFLAKILAVSMVLTAAPAMPGIEADAKGLSIGSQTGGGYLNSVTNERTAGETPDITTGLVGYYGFEDSLDNEVSKTGGKAALHGGAGDTWNSPASGSAVYADSKDNSFGKAYKFLGDTGSIEGKDFARGEGLELDVKMPKTFTISYWVNPRTVKFGSSMIFSPVSVNEGLNIMDYWNADYPSFPTARVWKDDGTQIYLDNFTDTVDSLCGKWSHITLTCDANASYSLYVDGKSIKSEINETVANDLTSKPIFLGINFWDASFDGLMDEVYIYNRALSSEDVSELYKTGKIPEDQITEPEEPGIPSDPGNPDSILDKTYDCEAFWATFTDGMEVTSDGMEASFKSRSKLSATGNYHTPYIVAYTGTENKVNGTGYKEYAVIRSDAWAWGPAGVGDITTPTWEGSGYKFISEFADNHADWETWLAANKSNDGVDCKISAVKGDGKVTITFINHTVKSVTEIPYTGDENFYISISGEQCVFGKELPSAEKPKPLAPYPVVLPTPAPTPVPTPAPTLPPSDDEDSEGLELDCGAFWSAHTGGIEVTESGMAVTFKNNTHADAVNGWDIPLAVAYTGDAPVVNGAGYKEYVVVRGDGYAWANADGDINTGAGLAAWSGLGYTFETNPVNDSWLEDNKSGTECKVQAVKSDGKVIIETKVGSVTSKTTFPVEDGKKVYISLTGEQCKLTNIKPAAYTGIAGVTATPAPSADPEASSDPEASPEPSEPGSTEAPGTTDPGTNNPDSEKPSDDDKDNNDKEDKETKKTMKVSGITAKAGKKKVTGKLSVKGTKVTVKIGSKKAKNAKVNGKKFTFTASSKLKKGTKVTIKVTKSGYKTVTKTVKVK